MAESDSWAAVDDDLIGAYQTSRPQLARFSPEHVLIVSCDWNNVDWEPV